MTKSHLSALPFINCMLLTAILFAGGSARAQSDPSLKGEWRAKWVYPAGPSLVDYGVFHYRRTFELGARPASFVVHVTGDNRYQLFVNGVRVVWGPARGDLNRWRYETVDIAPHLRAGKNVLAAVVWNFSTLAGEAQVTNQTGFLLQGDTAAESVVDTGVLWKCVRNEAYQPIPFGIPEMRTYYVVGPGDRVDAAKYPWGWETPEFDDAAWPQGKTDGRSGGFARGAVDAHNRWFLWPRSIPLMEETPERLAAVRQVSSDKDDINVPPGFPRQPAPFQIPARTSARLLLDRSHLTVAYPELIVSGGQGAVITVGYAESLFVAGTKFKEKGNRNEVEGKEFHGNYDVFIADGGRGRMFRPLFWRTYRYLELKIETKDEALTIDDLRATATGYPLVRRARFEGGSETLQKILDAGWRTLRTGTHEIFTDSPYYEQLQYAGDARIESLVTLYNAGDARIVRNAIELIDDSRLPDGLTMSRAPTRLTQVIPSYSLLWIGMLHDYWRYVDDPAFVKEMLPGMRAVLGWFERRQKSNGSLGPLEWWDHTESAGDWPHGKPPSEPDGSSAQMDLLLLMAYNWAAELEAAQGSPARAAECRAAAARLRAVIAQLYWDEQRQLFAETPRKRVFADHANALAVIAGVVKGAKARSLMRRVLEDTTLTRTRFHFRHYLHEAINKAGEGDRYLELLGDWEAMLDRGLTTWAEFPEEPGRPSRSDSHAWTAHPNFEVLRTVLGVDSAAPGFRRVVIRPHLGRLTEVSGAVPHPQGEVAVSLKLTGGRLAAEVSLPAGVTGEFIWRGRRRPLPPGKSRLAL